MKWLFTELRRRRVPQVVGLYLVASFGILQGAELALPRLGLPDWTVTLLLVLAIVGLPVVAALAWAYDLTGQGVERTPPRATATPLPASDRGEAPLAGRIAMAGAVVVLALAGTAFAVFSGTERVPLEEGTVAVMPFRVSGGLVGPEGMVDLLSTRLSGDYGPRALDPRVTLRAWREAGGSEDLLPDELKEAARRVGASHMLTGEVVEAGPTITVSATLEPTVGAFGRRHRASVAGPADSILALVDHLTASLLSQQAGEAEDRLADLTSTSLPAVASYLTGRKLHREGRFRDAVEAFDRAVAIDSTFALAAVGLRDSWGWIGPHGTEYRRATRLAWEHRSRLSRRDLAVLVAQLGPRHPETSSPEEMVRALRSAIELAPEDATVWEMYGDQILHYGHLDLSADPAVEAREALEEAWRLDPEFTSPLIHLVEFAARDRDTAALRRYFDAYLAAVDEAEHISQLYIAALGLGDSALAAGYEARLHGSSVWARPASRVAALPQDGFRRWLDRDIERETSPTARANQLLGLAELEASVGRTDAATEAFRAADADGAHPGALALAAYRSAMLLGGDVEYAAERLRDRARLTPSGDPASAAAAMDAAGGEAEAARPAWAGCLLDRLRLEAGDTAGVARAGAELRRFRPGDDSPAAHGARVCGLELTATLKAIRGEPGALAALDTLLAALRPDPVPMETLVVTSLLAARLRHDLGDHRGALAIARRFQLVADVAPAAWLIQARAAARLGHRDEAVAAYRRYVEYRSDAAPGSRARAEVDAARLELAGLIGEAGR